MNCCRVYSDLLNCCSWIAVPAEDTRATLQFPGALPTERPHTGTRAQDTIPPEAFTELFRHSIHADAVYCSASEINLLRWQERILRNAVPRQS